MVGLVALAPRVIFAFVWLGLVVFLRRRKRADFVYLLFFSLFCIYLYAVIEITVLQFQSLVVLKYLDPGIIMRGIEAERSLNLVPLLTLGADDIRTSALNVLMMVPFGLGLPLVRPWRFGKVLAAGVLLSLSIETLQYVSGQLAQTTFRVADINDVIFNTAGTALGYLVFAAKVRLARGLQGEGKQRGNPILRALAARPQI